MPLKSSAAENHTASGKPRGRARLAVTSVLFPDTLAGNLRRIADAVNRRLLPLPVDEVALCLFQTSACLAYGPDDLSPGPLALPFSCHLHLPLDLPWERPGAALDALSRLLELTRRLAPRAFVLHPPPSGAELAEVARLLGLAGHAPSTLLVENLREDDLSGLAEAIHDLGCGVCLDIGHLSRWSDEGPLLPGGLDARVSMVHACGTDPSFPSRHLSLGRLDARGRALLVRAVGVLPDDGVLTVEVFGWDDLTDSFAALPALLPEFFAEGRGAA